MFSYDIDLDKRIRADNPLRKIAEVIDLSFVRDEVPDHSVLSKALKRWGRTIFEQLFVRSVQQCVEAGLVGGTTIHVDGTVIAADASQASVVRAGPELIAELKRLYVENYDAVREGRPNGVDSSLDILVDTPNALNLSHRFSVH